MKIIINSPPSLSEAIGTLRQLFKEKPYLELKVSQEKTRSLSLNAVLHRWCTQVAVEEKEYTDDHVKCLVKHFFFMPIHRGEDAEYNALCEKFVDSYPYEQQVEIMRLWPVTRLMKSKPMLRGMEAMQAHYAGRVELEFGDK